MKVGFTGTQKGCTTAQLHTLRSLLMQYAPEEFHHGCCVGADTQAHHEAYRLGIPLVYHPPIITDKMSDLRDFPGTWRKPKPYLRRNDDIVAAVEILIACPGGEQELRRSGTWYTIRRARRTQTPHIIIYPSGKTGGLRAC